MDDTQKKVGQLNHFGYFDRVVGLHGPMACRVLTGADGTSDEIGRCLLLATLRPRIAQHAISRAEGLAHEVDPQKVIGVTVWLNYATSARVALMLNNLRAAWPFWLRLTMAAAAVFLIASLGTWWTNDRADFPGWLEAVSTSAALLAAVVAARYTAHTLNLERTREDRLTQDRRLAQASRVAAWYGSETREQPVPTSIVGGTMTVLVHGVMVRNASDLPVTGAIVQIEIASDVANTDGEYLTYIGHQWLGLVPPSDQPAFVPFAGETAANFDLAHAALVGDTDHSEVRVQLTLRDSSNVWWLRSWDGHLDDLETKPSIVADLDADESAPAD